ncbi:aflatoxin B1 aldehyde reductase member 4 [Favolaschia claudopus]|uniref:Aflatoxin B1 aldehyde reductase member 4 n=1 Tax=Favolaschia claudopus TaxID=2862362 RepID=A0AAW0AYT9_9AGAR
MSSVVPVKAIVGGYAFGHPKSFPDVESIDKAYKLLKELGCDNIDTARVYGKSEEWLGKTGAGKLFTIDTKTPGGAIPGTSTREGIMQHITDSLGLMKVNQVDVFYLHAPDDSLDLEDQLKGINEAYQAGYFKRFGLSNFLAADVQRVYDICEAKGYPLPSVYQGNYNAVARKIETEIVPTLRKLNIAFYVYSPIAGGLLAKTSQQMQSGGAEAGRFAKGDELEKLYGGMYNKPSMLEALNLWAAAAKVAGCSPAELAYRWVAFDSVVDSKYGDAVIFGVRNYTQIEETMGWLKAGTIGQAAKDKIDEIWKVVEKDSPLDNYNSFHKQAPVAAQ